MIQRHHILIFVAKDQFSDIEFLTIKNYLLQNKIKFSVISDTNNYCRSDKNKLLVPDVKTYNVNINNFDALVIVGGEGILEYSENYFLKNLVTLFKNAKKILSAVCNAPIIFDKYKIIQNQQMTCYPSNKHLIENNNFSNKKIIINDNIIMAQSSKEALEMIKILISILKG